MVPSFNAHNDFSASGVSMFALTSEKDVINSKLPSSLVSTTSSKVSTSATLSTLPDYRNKIKIKHLLNINKSIWIYEHNGKFLI